MSSFSFNLVTEPWIQVTTRTGERGRVEELGLHDLFERLDEVVDVIGPLHVWLGIVRTLACVFQRTLAPADDAAWVAGLAPGNWAGSARQKRVLAYLKKWQHRFDLFDAERPFLQIPRPDAGAKVQPVVKLTLTHAAGLAARLMDWSSDADPCRLTPAEAARALCGAQACAVAGGQSFPWCFSDSPCLSVTSYMLTGATLQETLSVLLLPPDLAETIRTPGTDTGEVDSPLWEWDALLEPEEGKYSSYSRGCRGILDHLSWTSRAVKLEPELLDGHVAVRHARIRCGHYLPKELREGAGHPWGHYWPDEEARLLPLNVGSATGRLGWELAFTSLAGGENHRRPLAVELALRTRASAPVLDTTHLRVLGISHKESALHLFVCEELALKAPLCEVVSRAGRALDSFRAAAEHASAFMGRARHNVVFGGRKLNGEAMKKITEAARGSDASHDMRVSMRVPVTAMLSGEIDDATYTAEINRLAWRARTAYAQSLGLSTRALIGVAKAGAPE